MIQSATNAKENIGFTAQTYEEKLFQSFFRKIFSATYSLPWWPQWRLLVKTSIFCTEMVFSLFSGKLHTHKPVLLIGNIWVSPWELLSTSTSDCRLSRSSALVSLVSPTLSSSGKLIISRPAASWIFLKLELYLTFLVGSHWIEQNWAGWEYFKV